MSNQKNKPKQYTHIDYVAILIQVMKEGISVEECLKRNNLYIARSTVTRNIKKIKMDDPDYEIVSLYSNWYVPNSQKTPLPFDLMQTIAELPNRPIVIKNEMKDLLNKLTIMNNVLEAANGNYQEAARRISSGQTPLGNAKITGARLKKIFGKI